MAGRAWSVMVGVGHFVAEQLSETAKDYQITPDVKMSLEHLLLSPQ